MDLLRISTAGSVDDGKSTLIGRLLYDNKALTKEQEALIEQKTKEKNLDDLDFSVITDGLIAERQQGITIDVAHIYFSSKKRKFIIADSPGHIEYTRNMVTGASNSEVSIILIDARKGLLEQSYRHFFISKLLRLNSIVFCINKMDLVDYKEETYDKISNQIKTMLKMYESDVSDIKIIPVSSLKGDNIVMKSDKMPWYNDSTLNKVLHDIMPEKAEFHKFRLDVQNVLHVQNENFTDYRGYTGRIASGILSVGDHITSLPSNQKAEVTEIRRYNQTLENSKEGDSISVSIDREIDISRGTLLVKNNDIPSDTKNLNAILVWLEETTANLGDKFILQAGSRQVQSKLAEIRHLIPAESPKEKTPVSSINLNDITDVNLKLANPIFLDSYDNNKSNGAFILINNITNNTCAVGFVR